MREQTLCRQQMSKDLMRVYREVVQTVPPGTTQTEVYEKVVEHQAPRFYIEPRFAHLRLSPMMRGDYTEIERMNPLKQLMYKDLYDVVMRLSRRKSYRSLYAAIRDAVLEPAPRFYIGTDSMRIIWKNRNKEERNERMKRHEKRDI